MDKNATFGHTFLNEGNGCRKMSHKLEVAGIRDRYDLILKVFWEKRLDTVGDLEDMSDVGSFQYV